jgi:hypothetical protein
MKTIKNATGVLVALIALLIIRVPAAAPQAATAGPPPFMTFPILLHVNDHALVNGHLVFGGEAAMPAPLAPAPGAASFAPATPSATAIVTGTDRDVSNSPDSYEGETGALSAAAIL